MTFLRTTTLTSAFALMTGPALADLSAQDVWTDWQELFANYGIALTTDGETGSGGMLSISGVSAGFAMPEGDVTFVLGDLVFEEQGDGSVRVTMAEEMPISVDINEADGKEASVGFTVRQPGAGLLVSGDPDAVRYDFDYPEVSMGEFTLSGDDIPENFPVTMDLTMTGLTGFIAMQDGDIRAYDSVSSIASMVMDLAMDVPEEEGGGSFAMTLDIADVQQNTQGTLGKIDMAMSAAKMVQGGMTQEGGATHGAASYTFEVDSPGGAMRMSAAAASGTLEMSFDERGMSYGGSSSDVTVSLSGDMIPFPQVNLSMAESGGVFTMPVVPGEDPQDFQLVMRMVGLEIDDMIWSIFDPAAQLPRDPATLIVDLGGKAIVTEDFTDPAFAENPNAAMPGTLEEVSINALQLSLAGAEFSGTGDFKFDNSMGIPAPSGTAELMLSGGNGLLDTLVTMGLLPQEQAMGARMMLGMFARPGAGDDTMVTTIEFTADGQILANGQRIR